MPLPKASEGAAIWVRKRIDAISPEISGDREARKDRPWLVLSHEGLHRRRLFVAPPMTRAKERERMDLCVRAEPVRENDYIDAQQIWTMHIEQIASGESVPQTTLAIAQTRARLRRYLAFSDGPRAGWLYQGRVVWVRLVPVDERIRLAPDSWLRNDTDLANWKRTTASLLGHELVPDDWRIPAVVITNDAYLPKARRGSRPEGIYALVSVVPLVVAPQLLTPGAPQVQGPGGSSVTYAPLTQCLLTLAYDSDVAGRRPMVIVEGEGAGAWTIDDETRRLILNDVFLTIGVQ